MFDPLAGECREDTQIRHQAYTNTWAHIKQCIDVREFLSDHKCTSSHLTQELLQEQYDTLLGQVIRFVCAAEEQWNSIAITSGHCSAAIVPPQLTFIPTATINAGTVL